MVNSQPQGQTCRGHLSPCARSRREQAPRPARMVEQSKFHFCFGGGRLRNFPAAFIFRPVPFGSCLEGGKSRRRRTNRKLPSPRPRTCPLLLYLYKAHVASFRGVGSGAPRFRVAWEGEIRATVCVQASGSWARWIAEKNGKKMRRACGCRDPQTGPGCPITSRVFGRETVFG
jgi:hypothetical protein